MPTIDDARQYIGIDIADDALVNANLARCLRSATQILHGAVGSAEELATYLPDDPRVSELILIYTEELYANRGTSAKEAGAMRRLVHDMEQQLVMELRRAKEAAGV